MPSIEERLADIADTVGRLERKIETIGAEVGAIRDSLPRQRVRIPDSVRAKHVAIVRRYHGGMCPCCRERPVLDGGAIVGEFDHATDTGRGTIEHTWLVCKPCNQRMRDAREPADVASFQAYQRHVSGPVQLPLRPLSKTTPQVRDNPQRAKRQA